jgi:predicted DNA-binding transcriptional regulator AlpA
MLSPKSELNSERHDLSSGISTEMLTAKELEAMLKIDVKTIYSYVQRGLIPYVRIQSNLRFSKPEIQAWIEGHSYRPRLANSNAPRRG